MKAYEAQQAREEKSHKSFQHVKMAEAPVCKKCGAHMDGLKRPTGIKFICSEIYCYNSFFQPEDK